MATTATAYRQTIHLGALPQWSALPADVRTGFETILDECARMSPPSSHEKAALLRDGNGIFRLRKGDYRLLAHKHHGQIRVLAVGPRKTIYSEFGTALERSRDQ